MLGVFLRTFAKLLLIASPFLAPIIFRSRLLDLLGLQSIGASPSSEEIVKALLSTTAAGATAAGEIWTIRAPKERLDKFVLTYVESVIFGRFARDLPKTLQIGRDIRINVMFAARRWQSAFRRRFVWFANAGFDKEHGRDNQLSLGCSQGIAGLAITDGKVKFVRTTNAVVPPLSFLKRLRFRTEDKLTAAQYEKTRHVRAILSIPTKKAAGEKPNQRFIAVGVINVDAVSEAGADWLDKVASDPKQTLISALSEHGAQLATLR